MPYQDEDSNMSSDSRNINCGMNQSGLNNQEASSRHSTGMTKAELRKSNKPIMEKKRRARINHCLNELKTLILEAMRKDPARHTKLEKADILEMTVKHLQTIQRQQMVMAVSTDPTVVHKFKSGFADCAEEVNRYIAQMDGLDNPVKQRLMNHLNSCVTGIQQISPFQYGTGFSSGTPTATATHIPTLGHQVNPLSLSQDINNNGRIQMGGVQFIPSRLPTGELALVMPNSSNLPFFSTANFPPPAATLDLNTSYPRVSAFNAVTKNRSLGTSPPLSPISSISSMGEDSSPPTEYNQMSTTPPLQLQSTNLFPTPPSGGSTKSPPILSSLQQPHISSTTETPKSSIPIVINMQPNMTARTGDVQFVNKKRPYPFELSDSVEQQQPNEKMCKTENPLHIDFNEVDHNRELAGSPNDNMWRPW